MRFGTTIAGYSHCTDVHFIHTPFCLRISIPRISYTFLNICSYTIYSPSNAHFFYTNLMNIECLVVAEPCKFKNTRHIFDIFFHYTTSVINIHVQYIETTNKYKFCVNEKKRTPSKHSPREREYRTRSKDNIYKMKFNKYLKRFFRHVSILWEREMCAF